MRKIIVTAALMLSINTSPAHSDFHGYLNQLFVVPGTDEEMCNFVEYQARKGISVYEQLTNRMEDAAIIGRDKERFNRWRDDLVPHTNMLANVYNTFCK